MPRTFAYLRVSTPGQTTDNQLTEIQAAGFTIEPRRLVTETVSGFPPQSGSAAGSPACSTGSRRVTFWWSQARRLGRNAMDVGATVARLEELGVRSTAWRWVGST